MGEPAPAAAEGASTARRGLATLALVLLAASAVVGSNGFGVRDRLFGSATPEPSSAATSRDAAADQPAPATALRSQPWWQDVTTLTGTGTAAALRVSIGGGAIQWRVRWTCQTGRLVVRATGREPVVDHDCPGAADGFASGTGAIDLAITAEGPWTLQVQQQVDVPLDEPPLPAMVGAGAAPVATGSFYPIDQRATGAVTIYRQADGTYSLRLSDFFVTANSELEVRVSSLRAPRSSAEFAAAPSATIVKLDVTTGSLNFAVPPAIVPSDYGSVVIWCQAVESAYAAATLEPAR